MMLTKEVHDNKCWRSIRSSATWSVTPTPGVSPTGAGALDAPPTPGRQLLPRPLVMLPPLAMQSDNGADNKAIPGVRMSMPLAKKRPRPHSGSAEGSSAAPTVGQRTGRARTAVHAFKPNDNSDGLAHLARP